MKRIIIILSLSLLIAEGFLNARPVAAQPAPLSLRIWGGSKGDFASAVAADKLGSVYVVGRTDSYSPGGSSCPSVSILKYSAAGNLVWQKVWFNGSASQATGVAIDGSGNVYITGTIYQTCAGFNEAVLLKLDPFGNLVWQKTITRGTDDTFNALAVDSAGNVFVTGFYGIGVGGNSDLLVMRFDMDGNLVWQKSWGGSKPDYGNGIAVDSSDNVYVTGETDSFGSASQNLVLLKLNALGQLLFQRIVGTGNEYGNGVGVDSSGNIYVDGQTGLHVLLLKFDSNGNSLWQRSWGGTRIEHVVGLAIDPVGNVDIAGDTDSYGAGGTCGILTCFDLVLMKIDGSGILKLELLNGNTSGNTYPGGVADSYGTIITAGQVNSSPPYIVSAINNTLGFPNLPVSTTGNSTLGLPTNPVPDARLGLVSSVSGNEAYTTSPNQFMLTFGDLPKLGFISTPGIGGLIDFNGTNYSSGQSITPSYGTANASAFPSPGYTFAGWNTTGGVFLSSSLSSTSSVTIQVTVAGNGTLTARFKPIPTTPVQTPVPATDYTPYYLAGIAIAAGVAIAEFFFFKRRKPSLSAKADASKPT